MNHNTSDKLSRAAKGRKRDKKGRFKAGGIVASAPLMVSSFDESSTWDTEPYSDEVDPWEPDLEKKRVAHDSLGFRSQWWAIDDVDLKVLLHHAAICELEGRHPDEAANLDSSLKFEREILDELDECGFNIGSSESEDNSWDGYVEAKHPGGPWAEPCVRFDPDNEQMILQITFAKARRQGDGWQLEYDDCWEVPFRVDGNY